MIVFTITVIDIIGDPVLGVRRTPAVFTSLETAIQSLKDNFENLSDDGLYQFAVIEQTSLNSVRPYIPNGITMWFKYNSVTSEFEECNINMIPTSLRRLYGFGIG